MKTERHVMRKLGNADGAFLESGRIEDREIAAPLVAAIDRGEQITVAFVCRCMARDENRLRESVARGQTNRRLPPGRKIAVREHIEAGDVGGRALGREIAVAMAAERETLIEPGKIGEELVERRRLNALLDADRSNDHSWSRDTVLAGSNGLPFTSPKRGGASYSITWAIMRSPSS